MNMGKFITIQATRLHMSQCARISPTYHQVVS